MKKWPLYVIAGLVLLVAFACLRGCKLTDRLSLLEGQHRELTRTADVLEKVNLKLEIERDRIVAEKDAIIADRDATIAAKQGQVVTGNKKLADLESEFATLGQDKDAQIVNLKAQVEILKGNLTLAYGIIADKDAIIAAWDAKFTAQVKLTDSWKQRFDTEARLHEISRQELGAIAGQMRIARLTGTLKSGLLLAIGGWILYDKLIAKGAK